MRASKVPFGCRVSPLVKSLILLEKKTNGGGEGDAVERLILKASDSAAAQDLIIKEAAKNPETAAAFRAYERRFKARH